MSKDRLFSILIGISLVLVIALTTREAFATADLVALSNGKDKADMSECPILPPQLSIETVYDQQRGMWVTHTTQGPTGVDGGLMDLMATYPTCSR